MDPAKKSDKLASMRAKREQSTDDAKPDAKSGVKNKAGGITGRKTDPAKSAEENTDGVPAKPLRKTEGSKPESRTSSPSPPKSPKSKAAPPPTIVDSSADDAAKKAESTDTTTTSATPSSTSFLGLVKDVKRATFKTAGCLEEVEDVPKHEDSDEIPKSPRSAKASPRASSTAGSRKSLAAVRAASREPSFSQRKTHIQDMGVNAEDVEGIRHMEHPTPHIKRLMQAVHLIVDGFAGKLPASEKKRDLRKVTKAGIVIEGGGNLLDRGSSMCAFKVQPGDVPWKSVQSTFKNELFFERMQKVTKEGLAKHPDVSEKLDAEYFGGQCPHALTEEDIQRACKSAVSLFHWARNIANGAQSIVNRDGTGTKPKAKTKSITPKSKSVPAKLKIEPPPEPLKTILPDEDEEEEKRRKEERKREKKKRKDSDEDKSREMSELRQEKSVSNLKTVVTALTQCPTIFYADEKGIRRNPRVKVQSILHGPLLPLEKMALEANYSVTNSLDHLDKSSSWNLMLHDLRATHQYRKPRRNPADCVVYGSPGVSEGFNDDLWHYDFNANSHSDLLVNLEDGEQARNGAGPCPAVISAVTPSPRGGSLQSIDAYTGAAMHFSPKGVRTPRGAQEECLVNGQLRCGSGPLPAVPLLDKVFYPGHKPRASPREKFSNENDAFSMFMYGSRHSTPRKNSDMFSPRKNSDLYSPRKSIDNITWQSDVALQSNLSSSKERLQTNSPRKYSKLPNMDLFQPNLIAQSNTDLWTQSALGNAANSFKASKSEPFKRDARSPRTFQKAATGGGYPKSMPLSKIAGGLSTQSPEVANAWASLRETAEITVPKSRSSYELKQDLLFISN